MSRDSAASEEAIVRTLTSNGAIPLSLCFVLRKVIYRWHAQSEMFSGFMLEPDVADVCREYLHASGQSFSNPVELADWARSHHWPNLDSFLSQIKGFKGWE